MITICYNLQLNEYFWPKFTLDDPQWTLKQMFGTGSLKIQHVAFTIFFEHYTKT